MVSGSCGSSLTASICSTNLAIRRTISSLLMDIIEDEHLSHLGRYADTKLNRVLDSLH